MIRFVTKDGFKKLKDELEERKTTLRQNIAKEIKEAKEQGDLSENAEYAEAKSQQTENESRISELEMIIKNSQIVEHDNGTKGIQIGSTFKVKWNGSEAEFKIVGSNEADPLVFKISNESPMGKSFLGKKKGDEVTVETPGGKVKYKVLDLK
jgi:transcription elongation factor GreA